MTNRLKTLIAPIKRSLSAWREVDPPAHVMALVAFAVFIMPGGIPLTLAALPVYVESQKRRAIAQLPA